MKRFLIFVFAALAVGQATTALATPHVSGLRIFSDKYPNNIAEGTIPVRTAADAPRSWRELRGFTSLLPYILPAPNQEEAGSCLYMSLTGIAEWWLAYRFPWRDRSSEGPIDLSERFLMNIAGIEEAENGQKNWRPDSIYLFNKTKYALLNRSYRFTKGWYTETDGKPLATYPNAPNAKYGTYYNWINEIERVPGIPVYLPKFERDILFADPAKNQWNIGVTPATIVATVKAALKKNRAPIHVIYNHYGYWHAVNIMGFDDDYEWVKPCPFVEGAREFFPKRASEYLSQSETASTEAERVKLKRRANKFLGHSQKLEKIYAERSGCQPRGAFFVRDSLYSDPAALKYDYDTSRDGEESHYAYPVIFREYEWLEFLANHVTQISVVR